LNFDVIFDDIHERKHVKRAENVGLKYVFARLSLLIYIIYHVEQKALCELFAYDKANSFPKTCIIRRIHLQSVSVR